MLRLLTWGPHKRNIGRQGHTLEIFEVWTLTASKGVCSGSGASIVNKFNRSRSLVEAVEARNKVDDESDPNFWYKGARG